MNGPADLRWYEEEDAKKRADAVWTCIERIERAQEYRRMNDLMHASFYGNVETFGFTPRSYGRPTARAHARLSLNVVRNVINTVVSKIAAKNKVHPKFLTSGAEPDVQRRAQGMEKLVGGIFATQRFYKTQRRVFRDIGIFGTGFVRPWADMERGTVSIERVAPWNILVDDEDGAEGDPRVLFHRRWYDKRVLAKLYPGHDEIIRQAGKRAVQGEAGSDADTTADVIPVIEAFARPTVPGADDGVRLVCVDSGELGKVEWKHDYHPFPRLTWAQDPQGFFGTGIAYELAGIQAEINELLLEFARSHRLIKGFWAVDHNARVKLQHINDDLAKIIKFAGAVPQYIQPNAIPQDVYRYLWDLYGKAYEIVGVNQLSASGQKPAGLNSGEAQRVYSDIGSERFQEIETDLEDWTIEVTDQTVDRARELAESNKGFRVQVKADTGLEEVDFRDVALERKSYMIQAFPTSMLPNTPAGRLAFLDDLVNMKLVTDRGEALKLLGFVDMEAFLKREIAPRTLLDRNIEKILAKGEWVAPEPFDDHELALGEIPLAIADARNKGIESERVSMLRRYIVLSSRLKKLQDDGQIEGAVLDADPNANPDQPPPPPPGMPGMAGPGGPLPPGMPPAPPMAA